MSIPFDLNLAANVAEGAARAGGALIRLDFKRPRNVRDKGINDLVTETDVASETLIVGILKAAFPDHAIVAEEKGSHTDNDSDYTWWIDPLDCTTNFVHGVPRVGVSIGCVDRDANPLVAVVYDPLFDECFRAVKGGGAFCNGSPIAVSNAQYLRDSLAASGFPGDLRKTDNNAPEWSAFVERCQGMARMGSSALDMAYVASGRFDLYWEFAEPPLLDRIAGMLIVHEAGGRVTNCDGEPFNFLQDNCILASNAAVHNEALAVLASVRQVKNP